jgi:capsular exopolysaccharide synthesis family protein
MDYSKQFTDPSATVDLLPHPTASQLARQQAAYYDGRSHYGLEGQAEDETDNGLLEYWHILRRHKTAILVSALLGLLLGFAVGIPMEPVYRARASLEVLAINEDFMNMRQASQTTTTNSQSDTSEEETQAKLLQSDALKARVFAKLNPEARRSRPGAVPPASGWRKWLHLPAPIPQSPRQALLSYAVSTLKVKTSGRTRLLELTADSKDASFAAEFTNTLVQEFIQQTLEARYAATHRTSEWLTREIEDARANLQKSEDALQAYARESGLIFSSDDTNIATEKLQELQTALSTAISERIAKQSKFELAKSSPPEALADVLNDPALRDISYKMSDLNRQIADLSAIYNPEYSKVRRAQAQLGALQAVFTRNRTDILNRIENDYQEATRKERLLSAAYDAQTHEVTGQGEKSIQYNILKREVDSNRQLYDTMLQQTKQASVASAMRASNVRVVDPAERPSFPLFPNFKLNSVVGLFAGLFLSVVVVTIRDKADRTLQQPGDVKLWLNLAELGTIPNALQNKINGYGRRAKAYKTTESDDTSSAIRGNGDRAKINAVELITWEHKPSAVAEAFRSALTSILFIGENGSRPRILVFTSVNPADGKTTIVSNLAIASAEIRRKVLVIDADMRRPRMHDIFHLSNGYGLTDLLSSEYFDQNLVSLIQKTNVPGLDVLPGGPPTEAAAHLLHSPNFAALLKRAKQDYDMILIDTPPVLQMTDARIIGRLADAVILVARAGQTTRDSLGIAKDRFADDRTRVLGTILNDWDPKRSGSGYYSSDYGARYYRYAPVEVDQN